MKKLSPENFPGFPQVVFRYFFLKQFRASLSWNFNGKYFWGSDIIYAAGKLFRVKMTQCINAITLVA